MVTSKSALQVKKARRQPFSDYSGRRLPLFAVEFYQTAKHFS